MRFLVATDTGGTFTDVAVHDTDRGEVAHRADAPHHGRVDHARHRGRGLREHDRPRQREHGPTSRRGAGWLAR